MARLDGGPKGGARTWCAVAVVLALLVAAACVPIALEAWRG